MIRCSNCGFSIDLFNESQPICPACGVPSNSTDPDDFERIEFEALEGLDQFDGDSDDDEEAEEKPDVELHALGPIQWVN